MASTFVIACPDCGKQIKVTTDVIGKKIRCKECSGVFVVKKPKEQPPAKPSPKPAPKPEETAKAAAKPPRQTNAQMEEEDDDGKKPYTLAKDDSGVPRCPNCVQELESKEARICLHCGFDMQTRKRAELKAVYEHTGEEKFAWRLPGILCVVGIVICITICIICFCLTEGWMKDGWFQDDDASQGVRWIIKPGCFQFFNVMLTFFLCYHLGRFAYTRLVVNNLPPEREIAKGDDDDEYEDDDD